MPKDANCERIVFLVSPIPRSGTNFVRNIFIKSGICAEPGSYLLSAEDWFLPASDGLIEFRNKIAQFWTMMKLLDEKECSDLADLMLRKIGDTLAGEIVAGAKPGFVMTKTPSSENISNLDLLFPGSRRVLLVRDGRDACYSAIKSGFAKSPREIFHLWAYRVDQMIEYAGMPDYDRSEGNTLWIRYESAFADPVKQLARGEKYLGVLAADDKRQQVLQIDIVGSSEFSTSEDGSFDYTFVQDRNGFNPVGRWKQWSTELRSDFKEIAGQQLRLLGYEQNDNW